MVRVSYVAEASGQNGVLRFIARSALGDRGAPATAAPTAQMAPADLPGTLTWVDRGDGTWQVGLDDWPLYYFSGDAAPTDTKGQGAHAFGADWYEIGPNGAKVEKPGS